MTSSETGTGVNDAPEDTAHFGNSKRPSSCSLYDLILIENGFLMVFFPATIKKGLQLPSSNETDGIFCFDFTALLFVKQTQNQIKLTSFQAREEGEMVPLSS